MNVIISRIYRINMGNYESFEVKASVSMSHTDLGISDEAMQTGVKKRPAMLDEVFEELQDTINKKVDELVREDINTADDLTIDNNSFIRRIRES